MTVVSDIITQAFREADLLSEHEHLTRNQFNEALSRLNTIVLSVIGWEVGEQLEDWTYGDYGKEYTNPAHYQQNDEARPPINSRVVWNSETPATIYLPPNPRDGARFGVVDPSALLPTSTLTLDANGRTIGGALTEDLTTTTERTWMYRGDTGNWVLYSPITANGDMPFPEAFDEYFVTMLAIRMNPRHSIATDPVTSQIMERLRTKLRSRYRQTQDVPVEYGLANIGNRGYFSFARGR